MSWPRVQAETKQQITFSWNRRVACFRQFNCCTLQCMWDCRRCAELYKHPRLRFTGRRLSVPDSCPTHVLTRQHLGLVVFCCRHCEVGVTLVRDVVTNAEGCALCQNFTIGDTGRWTTGNWKPKGAADWLCMQEINACHIISINV